jgi:hypothetical protein
MASDKDLKEDLQSENSGDLEVLPKTGEIPVVTIEEDKEQEVKSPKVTHRDPNPKKGSKKFVIIPIVALVVIAFIVACVLYAVRKPPSVAAFLQGDWSGEGVVATEFFGAKTVDEVNTQKPQMSFKAGDPIILRFTLENPQTDDTTTYVYEIKDQKKEVVRTGTIQVSKSADDTVKRYIGLVTSSRSQIDVGSYKLILKDQNGTEKLQRSFKITN